VGVADKKEKSGGDSIMGKINYGRVVIGGLLAGLIISVAEYVLNEIVLGRTSS
jgi:hypothetical protein